MKPPAPTPKPSSRLLRPPPLAAIRAELARREAERRSGDAAAAARDSFAEFVRQGWHVVEPEEPLVWNWHLDLLCGALAAAARGDERARRLILNIPPGHAKSLVVAVLWPAWVWTWRPTWQAIFSSYDRVLAVRDSVRTRDLVTSDWYRRTFRPDWELKGDQNVKSYFANTAGGWRVSTSVGGAGTGYRADVVVVDDAHNVKARPTDDEFEGTAVWWQRRMSNRLRDQARGVLVVMGQRVDERDLTGRLLRRGGYSHISLPTEFDPDRRCVTPWGKDPRTEPGELLFEAKFGPKVIEEAKLDLGPEGFAAQHQQTPAPRGGNKVKGWWLRFYYRRMEAPPAHVVTGPDGHAFHVKQDQLPKRLARVVTSWDMPFKKANRKSGKPTTSNVAGHVLGELGANVYLLDRRFGRMTYPEAKDAVRELVGDWPEAEQHLIEDKAYGSPLIDDLQDEIPGLLPIEPYGDKELRLDMTLPRFRSGNVWLPHPVEAPWVLEVIAALLNFPAWIQADDVDALTQGVLWLRREASPEERLKALGKM